MTKCIVLICGPPACLKSTLAQILHLLLNHRQVFNLQVLCLASLRQLTLKKCTFLSFDQILFGYENEIIENETNWKSYRSFIADEIERVLLGKPQIAPPEHLHYAPQILHRLSQALQNILHKDVLFIDDNFYYSSMRHRYRQIAQRAGLGFLCIHLYSNFSVACRRNQQRECVKRVSDSSMANIYSKYELFPEDFLINTTDRGITSEHLQRIVPRIERACHEPEEAVDVNEEEEQRRRATEINQRNFLYQLDQKLRKFTSRYLQEAFARHEKLQTGNEKKLYAEKINDQRQAFLDLVKRRFILLEPNDDVERVFECFLHEKNELDGYA